MKAYDKDTGWIGVVMLIVLVVVACFVLWMVATAMGGQSL